METIYNHMQEFALDEISFVEQGMQDLARARIMKKGDGGLLLQQASAIHDADLRAAAMDIVRAMGGVYDE